MSFFHASFKDLGETLRTVSLVIGLLVTSFTGVGYIYTLISDQKAMAVEITDIGGRLSNIESEEPDRKVDQHRLTQLEHHVDAIDTKVDKMQDFLQDFRAEVAKKLR
jgi:cob(I)alamin adenosyltransferase